MHKLPVSNFLHCKKNGGGGGGGGVFLPLFGYLNCKLSGVKLQVIDRFVNHILALCEYLYLSNVHAHVWAMIIMSMHACG